jgi:hypothetical protein
LDKWGGGGDKDYASHGCLFLETGAAKAVRKLKLDFSSHTEVKMMKEEEK